MSTPPINLNQLEYQQIYDNIKSYIKSKSDFSDFDFDGSALSTILDILAYNTHYHILFQNILVNEMFLDSAQKVESLISHAKLLGKTVQNRYCSTARLKASSVNSSSGISEFSRLVSLKTNNSVLNFYTIDDSYSELVGAIWEITFDVYEASTVVVNQTFTVDVDKQSVYIPNSNIDLRTLRVDVRVGENLVRYQMGNASDSNPYENENIFYVENVSSGFDIIFPSRMTGVGLPLESDAEIKISYLVPSGSNGNDASSFTFPTEPSSPTSSTIGTGSSITSLTGNSSGGSGIRSLDSLKESIPKTFASQNRLVTKADIKSALYDAGYASSISNVTVEVDPSTAGKVWVSTDLGAGQEEVIIAFINGRSVLGIEFKYGIVSGAS